MYAAKRAALLFKELAGGTISSEITDVCVAPAQDFVFDISFARIDALIGKHILEETVRTILDGLEVKVLAEKDGVLTVAVPPYRVDVQREADLIEDICGFTDITMSRYPCKYVRRSPMRRSPTAMY